MKLAETDLVGSVDDDVADRRVSRDANRLERRLVVEAGVHGQRRPTIFVSRACDSSQQ